MVFPCRLSHHLAKVVVRRNEKKKKKKPLWWSLFLLKLADTVVFPVNVRKIEVSTDDDGVVRVVHSPGADVQERGIKQLQIFIVARWWSITKRSENDTPQPLDQWTSSPFIGQQVANCKSFTLTLYLADLFAMHHGPRSIPLCAQHHIQLTPLPFQVSQTSHSRVTTISIFYLENPRSRSWVRSKFEVTMWV